MGVRADSGIDTVADVKGKEVVPCLASPSNYLVTTAMLAFSELTWDDVVAVDYPSSAKGYEAVGDAKADACFFNCKSSSAYEISALRAA